MFDENLAGCSWQGMEEAGQVGTRYFSTVERMEQLAEFEGLCRELARIFRAHGDARHAGVFDVRAIRAGRLRSGGFIQSDLNDLAYDLPTPWWLHPKAADYGAAREPWQEEVARVYGRATEVAQLIRAIAVFDS